jgi:SAM-dependent methyltransferase
MTDNITSQEQMGAYREAVISGLYAKKTGLVGKYDNVRRYWEDEITRHFLYPHLKKLIERASLKMRRLRIMDLGCGSADGLELLRGIRDRDPDLNEVEVNLLTPDIFGFYNGIDLSKELLGQARSIYNGNSKITFTKADFCKGLPKAKEEEPYDLYFSSYGSSSHHNNLETLVHLLSDIAKSVKDYCVIVCDWLGRYSYEWQSLWTNNLQKNCNMDYVVSYIYDQQERELHSSELQHLNLRLMCRKEVDKVIDKASERAGVKIKPLTYFDRSVFTGRHMDTAQYNNHAQPIRQMVNSLHEPNMRTDLNSLLIDYIPKKNFDFINNYYEHLQACWNTLIKYTQKLISTYDEHQRNFNEKPEDVPASYPPALRDMMERMRLVVEGVGWLGLGLPRENIIEPQLGYALRYLIMNLQQGIGCGHGFCGIFEVDKN